jgi:hypothetical protein
LGNWLPVNPTSPEPAIKSLKEELLDMAAQWKVDAVTVIERSPVGSHAATANQMLAAYADMLISKIQHRGVESPNGNSRRN